MKHIIEIHTDSEHSYDVADNVSDTEKCDGTVVLNSDSKNNDSSLDSGSDSESYTSSDSDPSYDSDCYSSYSESESDSTSTDDEVEYTEPITKKRKIIQTVHKDSEYNQSVERQKMDVLPSGGYKKYSEYHYDHGY